MDSRSLQNRMFFLLFGLFAFAMAYGQRLDFAHYGTLEGLPSNGVYDLLQDDLGYLWIATQGGGIARFDGKDFESWDQLDGLSDDVIRCLHQDDQGHLWVGTAEGGVNLFSKGEWSQPFWNDQLPSKHVRSIAFHQGKMYLATLDEGVLEIDTALREITAPNTIAKEHARALQTDAEGHLWAGTDKGLYVKREDNTWKRVSDEHQVLCLFAHENGIYFGTKKGLFLADTTKTSKLSNPVIEGLRVRTIATDAHGDFWIGTSSGAYQFEAEDALNWTFISEIDQEQGLDNSRIRKLLLDRSNTLWFGTYFGGISQLKSEAFSKFTKDNHYPESFISAVHVQDSSFWLGTFDGAIYHNESGTLVKQFQSETPEADNPVIKFFTKNGEPWALLQRDGLVHLKSGSTFNPRQETLWIDHLNLKKEHILLTENTFYRQRGSRINFPFGRMSCIQQNDSLLFAATSNGVRMAQKSDRFESLTWDLIEATDGISISCSAVDSQGNIWWGSEGGGIFKWDGEIEHFNRSSLFKGKNIKAMVFDARDNLWISTEQGMLFLELAPGQEFILNSELYERDISGYAAKYSMVKTTSGDVWFGTTRGMYQFHPGGQFRNERTPVLDIEALRVNNDLFPCKYYFRQTVPYGTDAENAPNHSTCIEFGPEQNHFEFEFRGLDLASTGELEYQCWLEGWDDEWFTTTQTSVVYPSLLPGKYTFLLRARNSDGLWNEHPLQYAFSIGKPWYAKWQNILLLAICFLLLVWMGVRMRLQQLTKQKEKLEQQVETRTEELAEEKQRSEELLLNILPAQTAEELKNYGVTEARSYDEASVLFSDFKGFTQMAESMNSQTLVKALDQTFKRFDDLCDQFQVEKIKTIGDAYMCATGLPAEDPNHALNMVEFAFAMRASMEEINAKNKHLGLPAWDIRIGIHSGSLIAGVVGKKKFAYDIWGDTVNIAARMESSGEINRINVSESTMLKLNECYDLEHRGKIAAKNKGSLEMYFVERKAER